MLQKDHFHPSSPGKQTTPAAGGSCRRREAARGMPPHAQSKQTNSSTSQPLRLSEGSVRQRRPSSCRHLGWGFRVPKVRAFGGRSKGGWFRVQEVSLSPVYHDWRWIQLRSGCVACIHFLTEWLPGRRASSPLLPRCLCQPCTLCSRQAGLAGVRGLIPATPKPRGNVAAAWEL